MNGRLSGWPPDRPLIHPFELSGLFVNLCEHKRLEKCANTVQLYGSSHMSGQQIAIAEELVSGVSLDCSMAYLNHLTHTTG